MMTRRFDVLSVEVPVYSSKQDHRVLRQVPVLLCTFATVLYSSE
jgi:hypothetical protein